MDKVRKELMDLTDDKYKEFHSALMPTVDKNRVLGIRVPDLRGYAKKLFNEGEYQGFLNELPHTYYEENNLHAFLIEQIKDFDELMKMTEKFLPYIDNWATCDMFNPKAFKKDKNQLLFYIKKWIKSNHVYTVRYAIKILMSLYLDEDFKEEYLELVAKACSEEYYVNMAISWYFATALYKQQESALFYFENRKLPVWVHNKSIQKAKESKRITPEFKEYLTSLKI